SSTIASDRLAGEKSGRLGCTPCQVASPGCRNVRRLSTGCALRRAITSRAKRKKSALLCASSQFTQLIWLSWHQALLLPCCVRRNSSPARIIGTPCDSISVANRLRACRLRSPSTCGSLVGPSTPQFQLQLSLRPSRLSSPLARLCLAL